MPERISTMETSPKITTLSLASGVPSPGEIRTPWVLFLEPDEVLDRRQREEMERFIERRSPCCAECTVERRLDRESLASFAWVPTRHLFEEPPAELRRYRTREVRLVHTSLLSRVEVHPQAGRPGSFSLKAQDCPLIPSALSITREPDNANGSAIERPGDFELFCKGHQAYYDDAVYCDRFVWPHSVYHTVRFHYIPSIIAGIEQGLGNPEIAHYALA